MEQGLLDRMKTLRSARRIAASSPFAAYSNSCVRRSLQLCSGWKVVFLGNPSHITEELNQDNTCVSPILITLVTCGFDQQDASISLHGSFQYPWVRKTNRGYIFCFPALLSPHDFIKARISLLRRGLAGPRFLQLVAWIGRHTRKPVAETVPMTIY